MPATSASCSCSWVDFVWAFVLCSRKFQATFQCHSGGFLLAQQCLHITWLDDRRCSLFTAAFCVQLYTCLRMDSCYLLWDIEMMGVCCNSITLSLFPSNVAWVLFISWEPCLCRLLAFSGSSVTWSTGALVSTDHHQAIAVSVFESPSKPKVYIKRIFYAKVLNTETVTMLS